MKRPVVLKLGGELLEDASSMKAIARMIVRIAEQHLLVVVHGGGKEIDAALAQLSIPKHQVDGLRVTDETTLQVVVGVLAGSINTRFVAAINAAGGHAVGLTGADADVAPVKPAAPHRATNGELVDLGLVGEPLNASAPPLLRTLYAKGFVPVIASIGAARNGQLFNVNADTLAGSLASRVRAARLVFAGSTPGVLSGDSKTIDTLSGEAIDAMISAGTATAGMIAKLRAGRQAREAGVKDVVIADGRQTSRLATLLAGTVARRGAFTRLT